MPSKSTIEELLVKHHYLTQNQLGRAVHFRGRDMGQSVEELLMDLGYATEEAVIQCAALRGRAPVANLDDIRINLKAADMVSPAFAGRNRIIPIDLNGDRLVMAAAYPMDQDILDKTATIIDVEVKAILVTSCIMERATEKTYGSSRGRFGGLGEAMDIFSLDRQSELLFMGQVKSAPVVRMVSAIMENAYSRNASDIHVEPGEHDLVIRTRTNDDLIVHTTLGMGYHRPMATRLKLMAGVDIAEKHLPQDEKYHYEKASVSTDLRISALPAIFGEKMVLRLLGNDRDSSLMDIKRPGMNEEQREVLERILKVPHGIMSVAGPTRSGETTTLCAMLSRIVKKEINVVTVEGPVEKVIEEITQVQVNPRSGLTFATALHSILRQDPDMIMVDEIWDEETVSIGVRAAITGYLVPFTLRTNDCVSTINHLRNVDVPPYMAAAVLSGIVSQRLTKLLRPECRKPYVPDEREEWLFGEMGLKEPESSFRIMGYPCCSGTGYIRRKAVHGLMEMDEEAKSMILDGALPRDTRLYQEKRGLESMREYVLQMVLEGGADMEEAEKIIYSMEQDTRYIKRKKES